MVAFGREFYGASVFDVGNDGLDGGVCGSVHRGGSGLVEGEEDRPVRHWEHQLNRRSAF